jgi:hypothetical protein
MEKDRTGRKVYTEDEILELGRKALARHKITVYVVHHVSKYDEHSISVCGGMTSAQKMADDLMSHRVSESWDEGDAAKMSGLIDFDLRLAFFQEVEGNISNGEKLEILERVVG